MIKNRKFIKTRYGSNDKIQIKYSIKNNKNQAQKIVSEKVYLCIYVEFEILQSICLTIVFFLSSPFSLQFLAYSDFCIWRPSQYLSIKMNSSLGESHFLNMMETIKEVEVKTDYFSRILFAWNEKRFKFYLHI